MMEMTWKRVLQVQWASIVALEWLGTGWYKLYSNGSHDRAYTFRTLRYSHGAGLAVVNPAWMRLAARFRPERFAQFAQRIFGISAMKKTI